MVFKNATPRVADYVAQGCQIFVTNSRQQHRKCSRMFQRGCEKFKLQIAQMPLVVTRAHFGSQQLQKVAQLAICRSIWQP